MCDFSTGCGEGEVWYLELVRRLEVNGFRRSGGSMSYCYLILSYISDSGVERHSE